MKGYIYVITNNVNGKQYIGKTTEEPEKYWNWHKNRAKRGISKVLYSSMRKHGIKHFTFRILEEYSFNTFEETNKVLNEREISLIKEFNSLVPNGYNVTIGGDGTKGIKRDETFKRNLREIKTGVPRPEWVKEKLRKPKTEEHKAKLRKPKTDELKDKLRKVWDSFNEEKKQAIFQKGLNSRRDYHGENNPFYGKEHSPEFVEWIKKYNTEYQNREDVKRNNQLKQPHRIEVDMIDPKTNKVIKSFIGVREAKRWIAENTRFKGDVSTISKAAKNGKISYGFKWILKNND